jgi:hypothetical protein
MPFATGHRLYGEAGRARRPVAGRAGTKTRGPHMSGLLAAVLLALGVGGDAAAQRSVVGTVVKSVRSPAVQVVLDSTLAYVGSQRFVINMVADAEQYLFVEARDSVVRRLYWLQFEGYRDDLRSYDYSTDSSIVADGRTLSVNFRYYPPAGFSGAPGSDGDRARQLLEVAGYRLPSDLGRVRLVWIWDDGAHNELMVIYVEHLADYGYTLEGLREDPTRWIALQAELLDRALAGIAFQPTEPR